MSEPSQPSQPSHKLSQKSKDLEFDTFIFQKNSMFISLLAGLNQKRLQANAEIVYRWLRLLMPNKSNGFELRPVQVEKSDWPFRYRYSGPNQSPVQADTNLLNPQDYGFFWIGQDLTSGKTRAAFRDVFMSPESFALLAADATEMETALYEIDVAREERVTTRDINCFFTGNSEAKALVKVSWIIPPAWSSQFDEGVENPAAFQKDENAILMRSDLEPDWHSNKFAVDVEDHHRIVRFCTLSDENEALLPQHLPSTPDPATDEFLRKHFAWCLRVNIEGADICHDLGFDMITRFAQSVGLMAAEDEIIHERPPSDDEVWTTDIGKEIVALESSGFELFRHMSTNLDS